MKCKICDSQFNNEECVECGFIETKKFKLFKKETLPSEEVTSVIAFLKYIYEINKLDSFISKKDYTGIVNSSTLEFFTKLKHSNDLKSYCKRNNFDIRNVLRYIDISNNLENYIKDINDKYVIKKMEEEKDYLDNILSKIDPKLNLDQEQRRVVLADEDYTLVIAGAGAGKTTTIAAKVKYLVDKKNINPKDILVISYTNKAIGELKVRINNNLGINCPIATFHSSARAITKKVIKQRTLK